MPNDDLPSYRPEIKPRVQVEILTPGEFLLMEPAAAERLEALLNRARDERANGYAQDIHRFSLCFESARGGVFTMPGQYWGHEFIKRIGPILKATEIQLVAGVHGADSQWDRDVYNPRQKERQEARKRLTRG